MPLTYQPFAETPEIQTLAQEIRDFTHELHMNVPDSERVMSGLAGVGLLVAGIAAREPQWGKWLLMGLGAALVHRGTTGQCAGYRALNIDRRHSLDV